MSIAVAMFCLAAAALPPADVALDRPPPALKTGESFRSELARPLTASWKNSTVRTVLRQIADSRGISVLLDRRIDPTQSVAAEFTGQPLQSALEAVAAQAGAQVSVVGDTVAIGPPQSTAKLRTLAALRFAELQQQAAGLPQGRLVELGRRRTLHWNDLDRPADILRQIGERYNLRLEGLDAVPHDLWAGATLPAPNAAEALSLVLIQFDLTFQWNEEASAVRFVPVPDEVAISRYYTPRGTTAQAAAREWTAKFDGLRASADGRRVLVAGTVEQHEAVAALLRPDDVRLPRRTASPSVPPLEQSYAKLKFERVPAVALIERLAKSGIEFQYDEDELKQAGIDLNAPVSMDLKDVTAAQIVAELCKLLELKYRADGSKVTLSPK